MLLQPRRPDRGAACRGAAQRHQGQGRRHAHLRGGQEGHGGDQGLHPGGLVPPMETDARPTTRAAAGSRSGRSRAASSCRRRTGSRVHRRRHLARARHVCRQVRERIEAAMPGASRLALTTPGEIRTLAAHLRPHVRGHLRARGGRRCVDRPRRLVVVVRRAGARAPPRVRHAASRRRDAPPDRARCSPSRGRCWSAARRRGGLVLGCVISLILIYVVNRQSFHWTMSCTCRGSRLPRSSSRCCCRGAWPPRSLSRPPGDERPTRCAP